MGKVFGVRYSVFDFFGVGCWGASTLHATTAFGSACGLLGSPGSWGLMNNKKLQKPKAKGQKPTRKSQKPKAKGQKPTRKSQRPKANGQGPIPFSLILLCLLTIFSSCTKDFEETNENINAPELVAPQFLLSNVIYEAANNNASYGWLAGNFLAQHSSNLEFLPIDRYDLGSNTELWNASYKLLNDLESIKESESSNESYNAVADILRAYLAANLTDLWNDVPFSEALQGKSKENFTPSYDSQESIYTSAGGILDLLEKAALVLENSNAPIEGDILYNGNLGQWVKFANSLRIRYLLRISNKLDVGAAMTEIVNSGQMFMGNSDNAEIPYLSTAPNQWFIFTEREGRYADVRMSATSDSILHTFNDPRMSVLFKASVTSSNEGNPLFNGIPNGLSRDSQNAFNLSDVSLLGERFRDRPDGLSAVFMQYSELMFALAEARERGIITLDGAAFYYENGINANFEYLDLETSLDYIQNETVALNGNDHLNKILSQKWISLMMTGYEAWFNYRRTGLPVLNIPQDNLNNNIFPVRYRYPESEQAANSGNYNDAVDAIGGDTYNSKGWWEAF